jgi:hypothetical protein
MFLAFDETELLVDFARCSNGPLRVDVEQSHRISEVTIAHYDRLAKAYWNSSRTSSMGVDQQRWSVGSYGTMSRPNGRRIAAMGTGPRFDPKKPIPQAGKKLPSTLDPKEPIPQAGKELPSTLDPNKPIPHLTVPEGAVKVVRAEGQFGDKVAIAGFSESNFGVFASSLSGIGLFAVGAELAANFDGNVSISGVCNVVGAHRVGGDLHTGGSHFVRGDIQMQGADYAEDFDVSDVAAAVPGTVMVLDDTGGIRVSTSEYDRRVAGVLSGAGGYTPAIILDRQGSKSAVRRPLALMGKVWCRVDASKAAIGIGDLLTTSATPGHAMKAVDPLRAFGAVIGKALKPLAAGCGLVPILVALQ